MRIKKTYLIALTILFGISVTIKPQDLNRILNVYNTPLKINYDEETEYIQIILYGQSLGMGWEAPRAITTTAIDGNFMLGDNVLMLYNSGMHVLNPLVATKWTNGGEQPIVSCLNSFSRAYRQNINANQKFIGMTAGEGGQTIERLSKECTTSNYYSSTFLRILDATISALAGKTVSCPAIIFMQGEYNSNVNFALNQGLTSGTNGTTDKKTYKDLLLKLKNNMQADIMAKYSQTVKPLFFIYQTSGAYISTKEMPIVMAQTEFADENSDVVLMNPHYALPDYNGGHLSTNGYRWYGEYIAKALKEVLINKNTYKTLKVTNFDIKDKKVIIDYQVPTPPLVLDILTTPKVANYGFAVYKNGSSVPIKSVQIMNENQIVIDCYLSLNGEVEITYAGFPYGSGNLRDSDNSQSMYTYFDDSSGTKKETYTPLDLSGKTIYGQHYGLQNWADAFYYCFDNVQSGIENRPISKFLIYPNPAKDLIYVKYDLQGFKQGKINIFNSVGVLVSQNTISENYESTSVNIENLPTGAYSCNILANKYISNSLKFIKN